VERDDDDDEDDDCDDDENHDVDYRFLPFRPQINTMRTGFREVIDKVILVRREVVDVDRGCSSGRCGFRRCSTAAAEEGGDLGGVD
jgi:hypothetical protein